MEHQRPNFDALPWRLALGTLIYKRTMRHSPRASIRLRIKALDQQNLPWRLRPQIMPLVLIIRPHGISLSHSIWIDQLHWQKILVRDRVGVGYAERVFADSLDGSPDVDDLIAAFEEALCVSRAMVPDAVRTGFVPLVDVHSLDGPAKRILRGSVRVNWALVVGLAADSVIENEDFGSARANDINLASDTEASNSYYVKIARDYSRRLQNLLNLGIINPLDLLIIDKVLLLTVVFIDLEPGRVQGVFLL